MAAISPTAMARARVMYWTFLVAIACTFVLSYPPTDYMVQDDQRAPSPSTSKWRVVPFTSIVFVLGFFMALGKAAVYKHIPVYYPNNVGAVGGLVGMIGGLGGFVLPIAFGALNDLTGLWTSCFMLLFVLVTSAPCSGCISRSGRWNAAWPATPWRSFPNFRNCRKSTSRSMSARCQAPC